MLFLILCNYTECEKMFDELKAQIEGIKKDILDLRQGQATSYSTSNMDELESLFSSLDGNYSPFTANVTTPQANLLSPPPSSPPFQFRPRANSVPPIYLQPDGYGVVCVPSSEDAWLASKFSTKWSIYNIFGTIGYS